MRSSRCAGESRFVAHLRVVEAAVAERDEGDPLREHQRHEQVVASGELARHDERRDRHVRQASVERAHPDERERARVDARIVQEDLRRPAERAAEDAPDDERRAEVARAPPVPTVRHVATIFTAPRSASSSTPRHPSGNHVGAADRELRGAVAAAEDAEPLPGLPEVRADDEDDRRREEAEREPAEARLAPTRAPAGAAVVVCTQRSVERNAARDDRHEDREQRVERQVLGVRTGSSARG